MTGQFASFTTWVNKASSWIGGQNVICVDAQGRACRTGADIQRARDAGAFPLRYGTPWPALFSGPMARACVEGRKTVTRRLDERWALAQPGDVLWGKETWCVGRGYDGVRPSELPARGAGGPTIRFHYLADGAKPEWAGATRVSIHMCQWMSRIVTPIASVRIERLQDITEEDARAEGLKEDNGDWLGFLDEVSGRWTRHSTARDAFRDLWWSIHGDDDGKRWEENPSVVRVQFEPVRGAAS